MLSLHDSGARFNRREMLRIGALGLGGLTLPGLLGARARAETRSLATGKSVIFIFQQGGPSQFETFDPKMEAPVEIRTVTGCTQTSVPGVIFGDTMQQLSRLADRFTIVRSFQTGNGGHNIHGLASPDTMNAYVGSLFSKVVGPTRPATGMPTSAVLFPQAVDDTVTRGSARGDVTATGSLGKVNAPFVPGGGGELQKNMRLNLEANRLGDRRELLSQLDRLNRQFETDEPSRNIDKFQEQAYQLLLSGGVADALDLSREDPAVVARYDTSRFARPDGWSKAARGKRGYYSGQAKTLGKMLLLARRLCEAGCGFVTVHADYEGVWDMHADGNNLNMVDGMEAVGRSFDHAVATFIEDVEARGLQDQILLVCTGEMGRTPKLNKNGGRDHWAKLAPLLLYGGGVAGGKVIGQSNKDGGEPATEPYTTRNLVSTILHTVLDVGQVRLQPDLAPIARLGEVNPIPAMG